MEAGIITGKSGVNVKEITSSCLIVWGPNIGVFVAYERMTLQLTVQIGTLLKSDTQQ